MRLLPLLFSLFLTVPFTTSKLVGVQLISRHGNRAANPVVEMLCPGDETNFKHFDQLGISPAGLTGVGMRQLYELGLYCRQRYIEFEKFLGPEYYNTQIYIRAVGEDRTLQSGAAFAQGMYPAKASPTGFFQTIPVPAPIHSVPNAQDFLLEVRKGGCKQKLKEDSELWDSTHGRKLWSSQRGRRGVELINRVCDADSEQIWKKSGENFGDAFKDMTDEFVADQIEQFPLPGDMTLNDLLFLRELAVDQIFGRLYATNEQITYMNGDLPVQMIHNIKHTVDGGVRFFAYHGHREMVYALAYFFGIDFNIPFPSLPKGAIPPGSTLIFELHKHENLEATTRVHPNTNGSEAINNPGQPETKNQPGHPSDKDVSQEEQHDDHAPDFNTPDDDYSIRVFLWVPCLNQTLDDDTRIGGADNDPNTIDCPARPVKMRECTQDCPLAKFKQLILDQIEATGTWQSLCSYSTPQAVKAALQKSTANEKSLYRFIYVFTLLGAICFVVAISLGAAIMCLKSRYSEYIPIGQR